MTRSGGSRGVWVAGLRRWLLRPLRSRAEVELALVDADVARWFVDDGQLSPLPLSGRLTEYGRELRERRLAAVERLERAGGRDPHPTFLEEPTEAQRRRYSRRPR